MYLLLKDIETFFRDLDYFCNVGDIICACILLLSKGCAYVILQTRLESATLQSIPISDLLSQTNLVSIVLPSTLMI